LKDVLWALGSDVDDAQLDRLIVADGQLLHDLTVVHEDTEPFLGTLREKGIGSAFVSNCSEDARPLLEGLGLSGLVDHMVLSCEVGAAKPDPQIYEIALDRLGVDAPEALFVDDQQRYCDGAAAVGMHAVLLDRVGDSGDIAGLADVAARF
jgi:putative hydrolase of the HAD superfamily